MYHRIQKTGFGERLVNTKISSIAYISLEVKVLG